MTGLAEPPCDNYKENYLNYFLIARGEILTDFEKGPLPRVSFQMAALHAAFLSARSRSLKSEERGLAGDFNCIGAG